MGMVDRYKKAGGFVQLLQVIETCGPKKREQFMGIIAQESPNWADALNQKCLTYDKILSWKAEVLLEVVASVNMLSFATAMKGLDQARLNEFLAKFSHQDRGRLEKAMLELTPSANEISASQTKVISETRALLNSGSLKADRIDLSLVIPHDFEATLQRGGGSSSPLQTQSENSDGSAPSINEIVTAALNYSNSSTGQQSTAQEVEKLQKKLSTLSKEFQALRQENGILKDKLEKIKKIA